MRCFQSSKRAVSNLLRILDTQTESIASTHATIRATLQPSTSLEAARKLSTEPPEKNQPPEGPSVVQGEVQKFRKLTREWWDPNGGLRPLHEMNPTRCKFMREFLCAHFVLDSMNMQALEGLRMLDVGCGGGILSEALARMGGDVLGIDVVEENIGVAQSHAEFDPVVAKRARYQAISAESLAQDESSQFDVVVASEVIEHVNDPQSFISTLQKLLTPKGVVFISTLNRTPTSYLGAVLAAEYLMRIVPKGTHDWKQFMAPEELAMIAEHSNLEMKQLAGMTYNPLSRKWILSEDVSINYIAGFVRQGGEE